MLDQLRGMLRFDAVVDIRGKGLICVIEFSSEAFAQDFLGRLQQSGVLLRLSGSCVKIIPPLIITRPQMLDLCQRLVAGAESMFK